MDKNEKRFLCFLFFLAFALRLGYLFFLKHHYLFFGHPGDDVSYYKQWAEAIVFGETSKTAFSGMPLFPYYLAVLFKLTGGHWAVVNFFNLLLGSLNCVLVYLLTKRIFSYPTAHIASLLTATNFVLIYYDWLMMPVTLLITLTLAILLAMSDGFPRSFKEWLILGIFVGAAGLGEAKFIIFAVLFGGYFCRENRSMTFLNNIKILIPFILGLTVVLGGITVRNRIAGGEWIFISAQSGLSLYVGNNPAASGAFENPPFIRPSHIGQDEDQRIFVEKTLGRPVTLGEASEYYKKYALNFIFTQPVNYIKLLGKKLILLASDSEASHDIDMILQRELKSRLDVNPYVLILPLALIGLTISFKYNLKSRPVVLVIASYLIYAMIYFVTTRQRAPILPLLIIFEAFTFVWIEKTLRVRQLKSFIGPAVFYALYACFFPPRFMDQSAYALLVNSKSGSVYDSRKDYVQAEKFYLNALSYAPADANSYYNLGTAYLHEEKYDLARQAFLKSIELGKFNVDATFNLGYIYEQTGQTELAIRTYQDVLHMSPQSLDAAFRIANLYQKQGRCDLAGKYFEVIIKTKPVLTEEIRKSFSACYK